jgi:hypothetical protein
MKIQRKSILVIAVMVAFVVAGLFLPGLIGAGDLEPIAAPGPTMKTLDEIPPTWSQILPVAERFELVMGDDAVLDKETGLVWARDANLYNGTRTWQEAINFCHDLSIANRKGWRLPTLEELSSLIETGHGNPAIPYGHPFLNLVGSDYWSSTTYEGGSTLAWSVVIPSGNVLIVNKTTSHYVWPVRGGN